KLLVIGISSGPFIIMPLVSFLNQSEFVIDEYKLKTEKTLLISFEKETECFGKVKIGNDQVESDLLGALALGANYFNPNETMLLSNEEAEFMAKMLEAKQRNIFYRFGMGMMLFFLLMLSSNYLLLGSLNHRIESNMELLVQFEDQLSELSLLQEEQSRKENLLRTSGLLNNQFLSFYAAELSHSVPQEIHFETIEIRPLLSEIKKKQKIEFQDRLLKISGKSPSSELLSNWIEDLKNESWISKVDIMEYTYLKNEGNFRIEILVQ
ncbi:MAG: hypothetical protein JNJ99_01125, partial [Crocinitomicaceae bacterium]|nr:hypothetical protein [Crocinitomicaceae bacterium]